MTAGCIIKDMNIIIKKTLDTTAALEEYVHEKIGAVEKLVKSFDEAQVGGLTARVEVARATERHKKGDDLFLASVSLELPQKNVRGEGSASDARAAIDRARDVLREEIEKYKTKHLEHHRAEKNR